MNLSAINFKQLDVLIEETNNIKTAYLLDKFIFWWQYSQYTLEGHQGIWFTRRIQRIADDTRLTRRTVERYLAKLETIGFIKRAYNQSNLLYIQITDKLLTLIGRKPKSEESNEDTNQHEDQKETNDSVLPDDGGRVPPKMAEPTLYKDPLLKNNSTVSDTSIVNNAFAINNPKDDTAQVKQQLANDYKVEAILGERITERFKNYVKGVLNNLKTQHNVVFSNPDKLFAEVIFSVINTKEQFPGIENPHHRMNIIAKLLRERRWKTPKGFYNHWDIGKLFKEREEVKERQYQAQKQEEGVHHVSEPEQKEEVRARYQHSYRVQNNQSKATIHTKKREKLKLNTQINELKREIQTETNYLNQAKTWLAKKMSGITDEFIEKLECKIAGMYENMTELQAKLGMT